MEAKDDIQKFLSLFGQKVKQLRKARKMTQLDLALKSGIDMRQIQRIEYGEISTSIWNAHLLASGLEISIGELFDF